MILCLDTISPKANVTLLNQGKHLGTLSFDPQQASEKALLQIDRLLKKNEASLEQLSAVALINGPGSFTGLRVGLAVANTLIVELELNALSLRLDQWWPQGIEEKDWVYLQSMNRGEVYAMGQGSFAEAFTGLMPIEQLPQDLLWSGLLSPLHQEQWENSTAALLPKEVGQVWLKAVEENKASFQKGVSLDAFYLKKPNITPAKKGPTFNSMNEKPE